MDLRHGCIQLIQLSNRGAAPGVWRLNELDHCIWDAHRQGRDLFGACSAVRPRDRFSEEFDVAYSVTGSCVRLCRSLYNTRPLGCPSSIAYEVSEICITRSSVPDVSVGSPTTCNRIDSISARLHLRVLLRPTSSPRSKMAAKIRTVGHGMRP